MEGGRGSAGQPRCSDMQFIDLVGCPADPPEPAHAAKRPANSPLEPPVNLNAVKLLICPNTSASTILSSLPVCASVLSSSMRWPPRATQISCCLVPLKLPTHAQVMDELGMSEWWYRWTILARQSSQASSEKSS